MCTPHLWSQNIWDRSPRICILATLLGKCSVHSTLRTTIQCAPEKKRGFYCQQSLKTLNSAWSTWLFTNTLIYKRPWQRAFRGTSSYGSMKRLEIPLLKNTYRTWQNFWNNNLRALKIKQRQTTDLEEFLKNVLVFQVRVYVCFAWGCSHTLAVSSVGKNGRLTSVGLAVKYSSFVARMGTALETEVQSPLLLVGKKW